MVITALTDKLAVTSQITVADVADIAAAGYTTLVNNRPDGEEASQAADAEIAEAARAAGLAHHYLPVTAANFPGPDFQRIQQVFDESEGPVLAYCRTGTRCTNLWASSRPESEKKAAREQAAGLGYDMAMFDRYASQD